MSTTKQSANFIVESPNPPEMHNVLWMDTSIYNNPVLKAWINGEWKQTYTDQSKAINLMAHSIYDLCEENKSVSNTIASQEETIEELVKTQAAPNIESELQTGKTAIANAITNKGVETSSSDSLSVMANKIGEIQTQEITIDGGEMYPGNMWGDYLHDLFKVATEVRNNGLYDSYAGFIVGQMYKGYATFDLSTIQADAYLTSDGDFYTTAQTHTWHDDEDGYADRYIVFFYTNENYSFRTTISGVCPRQIVVVGKCAKIYIDYNRITQLYVFTELGGELGNFSVGSNTPQGNWMFVQNIRGYKNHDSGYFFHNASQLGFVSFADLKAFSGGGLFHASSANSMFNSMISVIFPELETIDGGVLFDATANSYTNISEVTFPKLKNIFRGYLFVPAGSTFTNVSSLEFPNLETCSGYIIDTRSGAGNSFANLRLISFPKLSSILGGCLFQMYNSSNMYQHVKTLEFPSLTQISGGRVVSGYGANIFTEITAINFPHLSSLYNGVILSMTANGGTQNAYNNLVSINLPELETISGNSYIFGQEVYYSGHTNNANSLISINLNCVKRVVDTARILRCETTNSEVISLEEISLPSIEEYSSSETNKIPINFKRLYLGYVENDRTKSVVPRFSPLTRITDIELKNGYLKPVRLDLTSTVLTAENIALHILDRLGDNIGNATLTCTIGSANLNRILADETYASYVAAAQAKNWTIN